MQAIAAIEVEPACEQPDVERLSTDVLIIGAGPAGSAAAMRLASRGVKVLLVDRQRFPRDKVCGDALIPDALAALDRLGLRDAVCRNARRLDGIRVYAPGGRAIVLHGECAVLPRAVLDGILQANAVAAGAGFVAPYRAIEPIIVGSTYRGAAFRRDDDSRRLEITAPWTILATGAAGEVLRAFGVARRVQASAIAARMYMRVPEAVIAQLPFLLVSFDRETTPGYGWVFPGPSSVVNLGVGVFHDGRQNPRGDNLRHLLGRFVNAFPPARKVSAAAVARTPLIGARLRTGLTGCLLSRPGLLVAGEASGTTYSFSGEGIGKAIETGLLAADAAYEAVSSAGSPAETASNYARSVETQLRDRFRAYKRVQNCLEYPAVANFLAWRADAGWFVRSQLEGLFNETTSPKVLFSVTGLVRALLQ